VTEPFDPHAFIAASRWTFAKTMPTVPHEYTVRGRTAHHHFEQMVEHIRAHGYERRWWDTTLTYLEIGGWKLWTMGAPIQETVIINREPLPASEPLFAREAGR
jgi:hypothetical protein